MPPSCFSRRGASTHVSCDPERSLVQFDLRSRKVKVTEWPKQVMSHIIRCALTRRTLWHLAHVCISFQSKVIERNVYWPYDVIIWPAWTSEEATIAKCLRGCHSYPNLSWFWAIWRDLISIWGTWVFPHWLIMGRSRNWPDLRSTISKIRDIRVVETYARIVLCKFQRVRSKAVPWARCQSLTWHGLENKVISR